MSDQVVLWSGGIDSTTALYRALSLYTSARVFALHIDYESKDTEAEHKSLLEYQGKITKEFSNYRGLTIIPCPLQGHYLTGGYPEDYRIGYSPALVPARNTIFCSIAYYFARKQHCDRVVIGSHAPLEGQKYQNQVRQPFPDCTPEWVTRMQALYDLENLSCRHYSERVIVEAPFIQLDKRGVLEMAKVYHVPVGPSWGCYFPVQDNAGHFSHCGKCEACQTRKKVGLL